MQISHRFSIAVHALLCIAVFEAETKVTSSFIAESVGVNPVVIRQVLSMLKRARFIDVRSGSGGAFLRLKPSFITLRDIYCAVRLLNDARLFNFHSNPNLRCLVGRNIHGVLDGPLAGAQQAMEDSLHAITLQDLLQGMDYTG